MAITDEKRTVIRSTKLNKRLAKMATIIGTSTQALALIILDEGLSALEEMKNPKLGVK